MIDVSPYNSSGTTGIDGTAILNSRGLISGENIAVQLPSTFSAFGFDYENYDFSGNPLKVTIDSQDVITLPATSGTKGFIGIVSTDGSFDNVVFNNSNGFGTYNAIDNVAWGNASAAAVPFEFSPTLGLLAVGSLWGVNYLRKKRATNKIAETSCDC